MTATVASLALIFFVTAAVLRPIGAIVAMSQKVIAGNLSARVGIRPKGEMGVLCEAVDSMADAVAEREERLDRATSSSSDAARSWPRSAGWRPAWPMKSTTRSPAS